MEVFHVDVIVNGKSIRALIDSGTSFSLMSVKTVRKLNIPTLQMTLSDTQALDASGGKMEFVGHINLSFSLGKAELEGEFHVWQNETHDMILGQDFLQRVFPVAFTKENFIFQWYAKMIFQGTSKTR